MTLDDAYGHCERLTAVHGRTFHLSTRMLAPRERRSVFAFYGLARMVDDVVDHPVEPPAERVARLDALEAELTAAVTGAADAATPEILAAADAARRIGAPLEHFTAFFAAMRADVPGTQGFRSRYRTMAELDEYMYGSAAVIGLLVNRVLGAPPDADGPARALGEAFQLTNFIRDVAEDLDRDRVYLPLDELAAFGVDEEMLAACRAAGTSTPRLRRAIAHLVAHARHRYRLAEPGLALLPTRARPGIAVALRVYGEILTVVEARDYDVMAGRAIVPDGRRLRLAAAASIDALRR